MSAKRAFFSIFQKIMVVCCAMFFCFADSFADNTCDGILNTGQWNQLMNGTTLSSWTSYANLSNRTADSTNNSISFDFVGNSVWNVANKYTTGVTVSGHKYFVTTLVESNVPVANFYLAYVRADGGSSSGFKNVSLTANTLTRVSGLTTGTGRGLGFEFKSVDSGHMTVKDYQIFDLTEMFGSGNEPTLADAQNAIKEHAKSLGISAINEYYAYNPGTQISYCAPGVKIATTAYNTAQFNPVVTDLNSTIATIRSVVTNTINQTKAIADLQAKKQTRPDEQCPAGKKCLLVEDNNGTPHWYEIIENIYGLPTGYTALEYIQSDGNSWIDTGITPRSTKLQVNFKMQSLANVYQSFFGAVANPTPRDGYRIYRQEPTAYFSVQSGSNAENVNTNLNNPIECQTTVNNGGRATVVVNGVTSTVGSGMNTQFDRSMLIFTTALGPDDAVSGTGAFKLWSFQIIKDDEEKFNGVPAKRNSDNAIGLYDTVTNTFFTNKGTGTFRAGPEM